MRWLLLLVALPAWGQSPYGPPEIRSWVIKPGVRAVSVRAAPLPGASVPKAPVPVTVEPWVLAVATPHAALTERNLLGSGLNLDLDGDGVLKGRWPLACAGGMLTVGSFHVLPQADATRLGDRGAALLLHAPCDRGIVLGVAPPQQVAVREVLAGPLLQISLAEARSPKAKSALTVSGFVLNAQPMPPPRVVEVRSFIEEPKPTWLYVRLILVPIPERGSPTVDFRVEGAGAASISAVVNTSPGPGQRVMGPATGRALAQ